MEPLSILVLGDLHFGKLAASADFAPPGEPPNKGITNAVSMKESLINRVKEFKLKAVFAAGDLTSIASPKEFKGAKQLVEEIAAAASIPLENIFYTFGNHDANWRISALAEAQAPFKEDPGYADVAAHVGGLFIQNTRSHCSGPVPGSGYYEREHFDLLVLNTGYYCTPDQKLAHGKIGAEQLKWAKEVLAARCNSGKWFIVMLHHHIFNYSYPTPGIDISTLEEGPEIYDLLGKFGVDLVCHGHRHHPKVCTRLEQGWHAPVTFFCSGSVGVDADHRAQGQIPNLFHVVSMEERNPQKNTFGTIHSFEYTLAEGWMPPIGRSSRVPLDSEQRFGSCITVDQQEIIARAWLETLLNADKTLPALMLPPLRNIPVDLQCMAHYERNGLLSKTAANFHAKLVGGYPAEVVLIRDSS